MISLIQYMSFFAIQTAHAALCGMSDLRYVKVNTTQVTMLTHSRVLAH